jgi:hypothetical protein
MIELLRRFGTKLTSWFLPARERIETKGEWIPVPYQFDIDWYLVGGEDYLNRINVPVGEPNGSLLLGTDNPVSESTSVKNYPLVCREHRCRLYLDGVHYRCPLCSREGKYRRSNDEV